MESPAPGGIDAGAPRERRLAAVVFTDVVGYSSMVQADEAGALGRVGADLSRMRAHCAAHGGECLNSMGDGLMLAFPSAVEALAFSIEMQEEFALRNEASGSAAPLRHRIGIHLGDVFKMPDGALAGDGVNTAARLEGSAPPGGICISQTVYDTVKGKLAFQASFAGPKTFKNIAEPVSVWYLHPRGEVPGSKSAKPMPGERKVARRALVAAGGAAAVLAAGGAWLYRGGIRSAVPAAFDSKSIAVLPFQNMSDDKDTSYFADGMHEDLLTQLALLGQLKVVSRTSVMEYRNTAKKMPQIGDELKVASLVEGSVRRAGNVVRVTAQLVDAQSDKHVWAANYDRDLKDIFKVQSELATEIAKSLNVSLSAAEQKHLAAAPTQNLLAYDIFLRHQELVRGSAGSVRAISSVPERIELLKKAVELDPSFALAWARLGAEHGRAKGYGMDTAGDAKDQAQRAMARALQLAPDDLQVKIENAAMRLHGLDDQVGSQRVYAEVLVSAPYNVDALNGWAETLNELGRTGDAVGAMQRVLAVDARNVTALTRLAGTVLRFRDFDRVLELRRQLMAIRPNDLELRAAYEMFSYWKTGAWDAYDSWRKTLPPGAETRFARVRNTDADRAIARRDFAEVHRLIDVDVDDLRNARHPPELVRAVNLIEHALAWQATGDTQRARKLARESLDMIKAAPAAKHLRLADSRATAHALLGEREAALAAHEENIAESMRGGNQFMIEFHRRERAYVLAVLG
ncbi:MAG: adenylate/guanylate cyclase domain-containing protein, partial [Ramlibacter sp.]